MKELEAQRIRTLTWDDPQISRRDAAVISGMDYLLAIRDGRITQPPAAKLIGYKIREVEQGCAVFELEPAEYHYNPFATVHGGIIGGLLDSAMTAAVLSRLPIGLTCSTLEMKVNFIRPVTNAVGLVRGEGSVLHLGSSIATAEGKLFDERGKLYAHAVSTCAISSVAGAETAVISEPRR
jgi:uncharacterized protein (TIGR00369 family)